MLGVKSRKMKPTKKHRRAIWECMLGTVYAQNEKGVVRYFDYDHEGAKQWAGLDPATEGSRDPRVWREPRSIYSRGLDSPRVGQWVLWILKAGK